MVTDTQLPATVGAGFAPGTPRMPMNPLEEIETHELWAKPIAFLCAQASISRIQTAMLGTPPASRRGHLSTALWERTVWGLTRQFPGVL